MCGGGNQSIEIKRYSTSCVPAKVLTKPKGLKIGNVKDKADDIAQSKCNHIVSN